MSEAIEVTVPIKTVGGMNVREHWRQRARRVKNERYTTRLILLASEPPALPCVVTLTRLSPGKLDGDNLQGAGKAVRDQVADFLGIDDADERIEWRYAQERCPPKHFGVRVRIEAA
jgi:hypothetical protein